MYHTSINATPDQLLFGQDMLFPTEYVADLKGINERKQQQMRKDNIRENNKRTPYRYQPGQRVLIKRDKQFGDTLSKLAPRTMGPYTVLKVFDNGTVSIQKRGFVERINI